MPLLTRNPSPCQDGKLNHSCWNSIGFFSHDIQPMGVNLKTGKRCRSQTAWSEVTLYSTNTVFPILKELIRLNWTKSPHRNSLLKCKYF